MFTGRVAALPPPMQSLYNKGHAMRHVTVTLSPNYPTAS